MQNEVFANTKQESDVYSNQEDQRVQKTFAYPKFTPEMDLNINDIKHKPSNVFKTKDMITSWVRSNSLLRKSKKPKGKASHLRKAESADFNSLDFGVRSNEDSVSARNFNAGPSSVLNQKILDDFGRKLSYDDLDQIRQSVRNSSDNIIFRIAIVGPKRAGKSTLLHAIRKMAKAHYDYDQNAGEDIISLKRRLKGSKDLRKSDNFMKAINSKSMDIDSNIDPSRLTEDLSGSCVANVLSSSPSVISVATMGIEVLEYKGYKWLAELSEIDSQELFKNDRMKNSSNLDSTNEFEEKISWPDFEKPDCALLCFDLCDRGSFLDIPEISNALTKMGITTYLIGLKSDFRDMNRQVSEAIADRVARVVGSKYYELNSITVQGKAKLRDGLLFGPNGVFEAMLNAKVKDIARKRLTSTKPSAFSAENTGNRLSSRRTSIIGKPSNMLLLPKVDLSNNTQGPNVSKNLIDHSNVDISTYALGQYVNDDKEPSPVEEFTRGNPNTTLNLSIHTVNREKSDENSKLRAESSEYNMDTEIQEYTKQYNNINWNELPAPASPVNPILEYMNIEKNLGNTRDIPENNFPSDKTYPAGDQNTSPFLSLSRSKETKNNDKKESLKFKDAYKNISLAEIVDLSRKRRIDLVKMVSMSEGLNEDDVPRKMMKSGSSYLDEGLENSEKDLNIFSAEEFFDAYFEAEDEDAEEYLPPPDFTLEDDLDKDEVRKPGTLKQMVERLTSDKFNDHEMTKIFLLLYRKIATPKKLLEALIDRFDKFEYPDMERLFVSPNNQPIQERRIIHPVQLRVCNILIRWLKDYFDEDLNPEFSDGKVMQKYEIKDAQKVVDTESAASLFDLYVFIETLATKGDSFRNICAKMLESIYNGKRRENYYQEQEMTGANSAEIFFEVSSWPILSQPICLFASSLYDFEKLFLGDFEPSSGIFNIEAGLSPYVLAYNMTIIDLETFLDLRGRELIHYCLFSRKKDERIATAPNVTKSVEQFNRVTSWVSSSILTFAEIKSRSVSYAKFIETAWIAFTTFQNYNLVMAILCALQSSPILRLNRTKEFVKHEISPQLKWQNSMNNISNMPTFSVSSDRISAAAAYRNMRNDQSSPDTIPTDLWDKYVFLDREMGALGNHMRYRRLIESSKTAVYKTGGSNYASSFDVVSGNASPSTYAKPANFLKRSMTRIDRNKSSGSLLSRSKSKFSSSFRSLKANEDNFSEDKNSPIFGSAENQSSSRDHKKSPKFLGLLHNSLSFRKSKPGIRDDESSTSLDSTSVNVGSMRKINKLEDGSEQWMNTEICIPFIGLALSDITKIDEASPDKIDVDKIVWRKIGSLGNVIMDVMRLQTISKSFIDKNPDFLNPTKSGPISLTQWVKKFPHIHEESLYQRSLAIEVREFDLNADQEVNTGFSAEISHEIDVLNQDQSATNPKKLAARLKTKK